MSRALENLWLRVHEERMAETPPQEFAQGGRIERCLPKKGVGKKPGMVPRFSPRDVDNMRRLRAEGMLLSVIAARYGVTPRTVRRYLSGEVSR